MFYNSSNNYEYNDCVSLGACSVSPNISSMQEVMYILLRQIAYYLLKLKEFGISKEDILYSLISEIALMDAAKDLSESQVLDAFSKEYINLVDARKEYLKVCKEHNVHCEDLKNLIKLSPKTGLSAILKRGEKEFISKYKKLNPTLKYSAEILLAIMKSVCVNLIELYDLGQHCTLASDNVLKALNIFNASRISADNIKHQTETLAECDIELLHLIDKYEIEHYGHVEKAEVSYSTRPNKAIMVSGSNLSDLEHLLNFVEDMDIDVYTNGNLLIAHAFPYFKKFKNLQGHFGNGVINTILDFATFPGAILLTKNESQNIEYLYRGRLFTTDDIAPKGVVKIDNNDFTPLVESAIQAKGFAKGQKRGKEIIGFNEEELIAEIDKIASKNYEKIFIIGHSNLSINQKDYFDKLFELMTDDMFAITFSYNPQKENVLALNLGNDYAILYGVLRKIFERIPITSDNLAFFLTKCDINSLSNIINLKEKGAKHIFLSDCPPLVINPAVLRAFTKMFNIYNITKPAQDLKLLE